MLKRFMRIFLLIALFAYTAFKTAQFYPAHWLLATWLSLVLILLMVGWLFMHAYYPDLITNRAFQFYTWVGSTLMGLWSTFILLSIPVDIGLLVIRLANGFRESFLSNMLLYQQINFVLLAISICITLIGFIEVARGARVKKVRIAFPSLSPALEKLKIAHISDLHIGITIRKNYVEEVVQRTNEHAVDLIFITGDLGDGKIELIEQHLQPLAKLKARYGIYFVTGNHEYYWNAEEYIEKCKQFGFQALINENQIVSINEVKVLIAGVTDPVGAHFLPGHQPDLKKAIQTTEETSLKILLAHRPDVCLEAEIFGFDLQCSGHTHAGQYFPFNMLIPLAHKYYRKLNRYGRMWVYVNPGTGYWGPANRFGIPAEISLLFLERA